jgi:hypothetical protein
MKFLLPNYSRLQNPWLGGCVPQIPFLSVLNWICWPLTRKKFLGTPLHAGTLFGVGKWRSACSLVVWLPFGVVWCLGTHHCWNCTLDISPCVRNLSRSVWPIAPLYNTLYASRGVRNTWRRNTRHLDHTDWNGIGSRDNARHLDHVTTKQGTWITWLQHKVLGLHWLEHKLIGPRDNTMNLDHVTTTQGTWITWHHKALGSHWLESYLQNVTTAKGTWITLTGTQVTWITLTGTQVTWIMWKHRALGSHWLEHKLLGPRENTMHLDHTDWNTSYLDHMTTQGTWITWLQHKSLGSQWLEHKLHVIP